MSDNAHEQHDPRPDVAKDEKKPREDAKDSLKNAEDTMSEPPAGSPDATRQSRQ